MHNINKRSEGLSHFSINKSDATSLKKCRPIHFCTHQYVKLFRPLLSVPLKKTQAVGSNRCSSFAILILITSRSEKTVPYVSSSNHIDVFIQVPICVLSEKREKEKSPNLFTN